VVISGLNYFLLRLWTQFFTQILIVPYPFYAPSALFRVASCHILPLRLEVVHFVRVLIQSQHTATGQVPFVVCVVEHKSAINRNAGCNNERFDHPNCFLTHLLEVEEIYQRFEPKKITFEIVLDAKYDTVLKCLAEIIQELSEKFGCKLTFKEAREGSFILKLEAIQADYWKICWHHIANEGWEVHGFKVCGVRLVGVKYRSVLKSNQTALTFTADEQVASCLLQSKKANICVHESGIHIVDAFLSPGMPV